jgi:hypothetical protein
MEFPDVVLNGVDVESILGEEEVLSRQAKVTVQKGQNF